MAIIIEANYGKKFGLPQYSSHSFQVAVKSEVQSLTEIANEVDRLYHILQASVDQNIREVGLTPDKVAIHEPTSAVVERGTFTPVQTISTPQGNGSAWNCSLKQQDYIHDLVRQSSVTMEEVEDLAVKMYSKPLHQLNRLEASGLIDQIKSMSSGTSRNGHYPRASNGKSNWRRATV